MPLVLDNTKLLQDEMLAVIHAFHARGWSPATSTNYSFRNPDHDTYTISRSGIDKGLFSAIDFMIVNEQGLPEEGYRHCKPSAETPIHTMLYRMLPAVSAVLHTHSVEATVLSLRYQQRQEVTITGFELLKGLRGITTHEAMITIPVYENSQDMDAVSQAIGHDITSKHGFLLAGHGLYTWGATIAEAKRHVEALEFLFECINKLDQYRP